MAVFSSRGPLGRLHQARRHRAGRPDPRRQHPAARPRWPTRPARTAVPGDRRHLDVQPALGRRLGAGQGGAPDLDAGADQVGADDLVEPGRGQGGRRHAGRPVRRGRRLDPRRTARSTRRSSSTRRTRTSSPRRSDPLHRIDLNIASVERTDDERADHDARGPRSTSPARTRTCDAQVTAPRAAVTITRRTTARADQSPAKGDSVTVLGSRSTRPTRRERPVLRAGSRSIRGSRRERGHDPGRVREEAGRGHADATRCAPTVLRRSRRARRTAPRRVTNFTHRRRTQR